jgi:hypothetical protein
MVLMRSGCGSGRRFNISAFTMEKMTVLAPIDRVRGATTVAVNPGFARSGAGLTYGVE